MIPETEGKATPGPWWAGTDEDAHMVYAGDCNEVASTLREDGDSIAEEANARLIAAAPELLYSCIELIGELCSEGYVGTGPVTRAQAAVNKAEGRS